MGKRIDRIESVGWFKRFGGRPRESDDAQGECTEGKRVTDMKRQMKNFFVALVMLSLICGSLQSLPVYAGEPGNLSQDETDQQESSEEQPAEPEEPTAEQPEESPAEQPEEQQDDTPKLARDIVVVLDPGHGGSDTGATRGSYVERDLALSIAYYCKEELEKYPGVTVYMTRWDNTSPCMGRDDRVEYAWNKGADLLVSLHLNATGSASTTVSGSEVYYPNYNYNPTMGSLGYRASSSILTQLCGLGLKNNGCKIRNSQDGSVYFNGTIADYLGINYWSKLKGIPGVLVEHAYINNADDRDQYLSTQEQLKALGVADATGIMNYFYNNSDAYIVHTGSWEHNGTGWWYQRQDMTYPWGQWESIDGYWFYFDGRGYLCTGWKQLNGKWYYLGNHGAMIEGWHRIGANWYYLTWGDGAMATGWVKSDGKWYYLTPGSGNMKTGWLKEGNLWYYLLPGNGDMAVGWHRIGSKWYHFDTSGVMNTGWYEADGKWYYSYASGAMAADTWVDGYRLGVDGAWIP